MAKAKAKPRAARGRAKKKGAALPGLHDYHHPLARRLRYGLVYLEGGTNILYHPERGGLAETESLSAQARKHGCDAKFLRRIETLRRCLVDARLRLSELICEVEKP